MGDKKEDEHITIPMPVHETSHQSSEIANADTARDQTSQLTSSSDASASAGGVASLVVILILFVILVPLFLFYALVAYLLCNKDVTETGETLDKGERKTIYQRVLDDFKGTFHVSKMISVIHTRIMIGVLTWLVINIFVKSLRKKIILGSHLWKWTLAVVILSCGYPVINMVTSFILLYIKKKYMNRTDVVYFAKGLKTCFNLIIFSSMLFLTWHFYFRSHHGLRKTSDTELLFHIVRWTLISLFIFSICWLIKETVLLKWSAHAIYDRFSKRILTAGVQLYFLALISGTTFDIFMPKKERERLKEESVEKKSQDQYREDLSRILEEAKKRTEAKKKSQINKEQIRKAKDIVKERLSEDSLTTSEIKRIVKIFITLVRLSSRDQEYDISDVLLEVKKKFPGYANAEELGKLLNLDKDNAKLFYAEIQGEHPGPQVPYEAFENWMVRAHKNCLALGYTLTDAQNVAHSLNIVMILGVMVVIICSWLLLMGVATTQLLLLITSPLLATTYVFADSCKTFLEGVMFAFARHSFDVGDLCLIDEIEMEVKSIGILTTSFLKLSGGEETIYPNSILATKTIVNLKVEADPNDCIELKLDPTTEEFKISELEKKIKKYINDQHRAAENEDTHCGIVVKGIGTVIEMKVHFKHVISVNDVTHFQCFETKIKQRSKLLREIQKILNCLHIKTA
ncbi:hypothetical protein Ancab_012466 [Ancistrocladus abbreviatus]